MFNVGDLIIYSAHGICRVDDIEEKTFFGTTKEYYSLHPIEDPKLKINAPVDSDKIIMQELLSKKEAEEILESFRQPGVAWIEVDSQRSQTYSDYIKKGNRRDIAKIASTLIREKIKIEASGRKFHEADKRMLTTIQDILFSELAYSLDTTSEAIYEKVMSYIEENQY